MIGHHNTKPSLRHGIAALETLLVLPLLLLVVLGTVGLVDLVVAEQALEEAAGVGARVAAADGTDDEVLAAIQSVLGQTRTEHATVYVVRTTPDGQPIPPGGLIEVRIEIAVRDATVTLLARVPPDRQLVGRAVMPRQ